MQFMDDNRKLFGSLQLAKTYSFHCIQEFVSEGDQQPSLCFSLFSSIHHKMLDIYPDFAVAGAQAGDKLYMLESLAECGRLGNYEVVRAS